MPLLTEKEVKVLFGGPEEDEDGDLIDPTPDEEEDEDE